MNKILISYLNDDNLGSIASITNEIINGLKDSYNFIPVYRNRNNIVDKYFPKIIRYFIYSIGQYYCWIKEIIINKPDIAHYPITSHLNFYKSLFFLLNAKIFGIKVVGHLHGGEFVIFWDSLSSIQKYFLNFLIKRLDLLIVLSSRWEKETKKRLKIKQIKVLNNMINSKFEICFNDFVRDYKSNKLLFIGTIGKNKGIFRILEALRELNCNFYLVIAGPEEDKGALLKLNNLINEYNFRNKVVYLGEVGLEKKIELFKKCGIFVFPSYNENFPLVVLEAACAGMPIITSKVGALPDFFHDGKNIKYISPSDINNISRNIFELHNEFALRKKLGEQARLVFLQELNRPRILDELNDIYKSVLNR